MSGAAVDSTMRHTQEKEIRDAVETASRLAAIVHSSTDGILTKDLTGKITSWNPACQAMFGYTADEVLGKSVTILYPKGTEAGEEVVLNQIRRGQPVQVREAERVRKDGTSIWVSIAASPLRNAAGHVTGAAAIKRDLTTTRALTKERGDAQESAARLAAVVESSIDGILTKDLMGKITSWNTACQAMFGYTADEVLGKSVTLLYPKGREAEEEVILEQIRRGEPVRIRDGERVRKDGTIIWVSVSASPLRDSAGQVVGAAAIKRDITEIRAMAKEVDRFKAQFINMAAHELWTPLIPLRAQVHLLMNSTTVSPAAQKKALAIMERNLQRLGTLVQDLLATARSETGRPGIEVQPIDFQDVLIKAAEAYEDLAKTQGIELTVRRGPAVAMLADPKRTSQVLANLLSNAFKFTPKGGHVTVELADEGANIRIRVTDSGVGIAKLQLPRLFSPFVQVHDTTKVTAPGSGLGLYICKQFIELHGGTIGAESRGPGEGATFWFTLPKTAIPSTATSEPVARTSQ